MPEIKKALILGMDDVIAYIHKQDKVIKSLKEEIEELKEHIECEEDGYPCSNWFSDKLDFHIKYHFTNEGGEYYENLKDLKEKPYCLDDLIYGSFERIKEENAELKKELLKYTKGWVEKNDKGKITKKHHSYERLQELYDKYSPHRNKGMREFQLLDDD
jgi:regulator of replication initiation timing